MLKNYNGGAVSINLGAKLSAGDQHGRRATPIIAQNLALYGSRLCQGKYGYFTVGTGVINTGSDHQSAKALYFQDQWQVTRHLTLNVGVRFDTETQPPFDPEPLPDRPFRLGRQDRAPPRRRL